ncbi:MAG: hypoxanthine phosphoribosyltransferase [Acidobacteriota bacterium]|jgi:hypoxanthine phosphoribosyltransferase|nr:hypoxanthine phosphoribosyltransferase [Acidobacteriota bacterium]NLT32070.1 hypoxanthine phosphoribosyltransferase [Acidobacteriota bacterium]
MERSFLSDRAPGPVLLSHGDIRKRVLEMGREITRDYEGRAPHLIGVLKGGIIFHADLVRAIDLDVSFDFIALGSYGLTTRTSGEVRLLKDLDASPEGRDVIIVEDIVDTGLTLDYLLQFLRTREPASLKVAALLDKPSRRQREVPIDYLGFEIDDRFVVGYGLDYVQHYRNLPDLHLLGN